MTLKEVFQGQNIGPQHMPNVKISNVKCQPWNTLRKMSKH